MMNKKDIFKKIGVIISELNEQYDYLAKTSENLNELEIELFMANSRFLSDHIVILNKLNLPSVKPVSQADQNVRPEESLEKNKAPEPEKPIAKEHQPEAEKAAELEKAEAEPEKKEELIRFDWPTDEAAQLEDEPEEEPEVKTEIKEEEQKPVQKVTETEIYTIEPEKQDLPTKPEEKNQEPAAVIIADKPIVNEIKIAERTITIPAESMPVSSDKTPAPTVNELLYARSSQSNTASQLNQQPVKDLKSIINLNDKLLFVKDLFNGYSLAYSEAIEILNRFDNLQAADNFLKTNYATKNGWASKQGTVDKLYAILQRRFG